jgi:hypothetical protein
MSDTKLNWGSWAYGLVAALIGGGAGAVTAAFGAMVLTPGQYGTGGVAGWNSLKLMALTFAVSGVISMFAYLKQSPLPSVETTTSATITTSKTEQLKP